MRSYKIYQLKNKLTIIICPYRNFNSIYFDLAVKVGSRYENKKNNGLAHLVEHVLSRKAMINIKRYRGIKKYLDENFTAYSLNDRTNFESSAHKDDFVSTIKFLAEILRCNNIGKADMDIEKGIILEEQIENESETDFVYNSIFKKYYYQNNPLRFEIPGTASNANKFTLSDARGFIKQYYRPENIILTIAGDINERRAIQTVDRYFQFSKGSNKQPDNFEEYIYPGDNIYLINRKNSQLFFSFDYPIFNHSAEANIKWEFFIEILSNYLSPTIKDKISCYSISIGMTTYSEFFDFFIEAFFEPSKAVSFYSLLLQELKGFKKYYGKKELESYKHKKLINAELNNDYPKEFANMISWYALMFGIEQAQILSHWPEIIKSITITDIYNYFDQLFKDKKGMVILAGNMRVGTKLKLEKIWHNWNI